MYRKVKRKRDEEETEDDYHMSEQFKNLIALVEDDLRNQQHIVREVKGYGSFFHTMQFPFMMHDVSGLMVVPFCRMIGR